MKNSNDKVVLTPEDVYCLRVFGDRISDSAVFSCEELSKLVDDYRRAEAEIHKADQAIRNFLDKIIPEEERKKLNQCYI